MTRLCASFLGREPRIAQRCRSHGSRRPAPSAPNNLTQRRCFAMHARPSSPGTGHSQRHNAAQLAPADPTSTQPTSQRSVLVGMTRTTGHVCMYMWQLRAGAIGPDLTRLSVQSQLCRVDQQALVRRVHSFQYIQVHPRLIQLVISASSADTTSDSRAGVRCSRLSHWQPCSVATSRRPGFSPNADGPVRDLTKQPQAGFCLADNRRRSRCLTNSAASDSRALGCRWPTS